MPEKLEQDFIVFANELADISAKIAKKYFRLPNDEVQKHDGSPVTKADKEIERAIREQIIKRFPKHGIIGDIRSRIEDLTNQMSQTYYSLMVCFLTVLIERFDLNEWDDDSIGTNFPVLLNAKICRCISQKHLFYSK